MTKLVKTDMELIKIFWEFPDDQYVDARTVSLIRNVAVHTINQERLNKTGITYKKVIHRVLYKKKDILDFINKENK